MTQRTDAAVRYEAVEAPDGWRAWLLRLSAIPAEPSDREGLDDLDDQIDAVVKRSGLRREVFVQMAALHLSDAGERLRQNAREWRPEIGLGVWPDRPGPAVWTPEFFHSLSPEERPGPPMHQLFRLAGEADELKKAAASLRGSGTLVEIFTSDDTARLLEFGREALAPIVTDPSFQSFPFQMPLLEAGSLRDVSAEQLGKWLCGASLYMRESLEDGAVFIVTRIDLQLASR